MDIETKHASLDTLSVTIQALHVNGKQMTLAVFRQLPETRESLAIEHFWGYVNYTIQEGRPGFGPVTNKWIVGSANGKLYRIKDRYVSDTIIDSLPQLFIAV